MKKVITGVFALTAIIACKKEETIPAPTPDKEMSMEIPTSHECYLGVLKNDSIEMHLSVKGTEVIDGKLSYKFYEKDKNEGTFTGQINGDTLFADYTFMSEGKSSVREVAFLKKGNDYIEGYGDVEEKDGKTVFKDRRKLFFDGKTVLSKSDCK
ncbi:hypothetical protein [Flavobacterium sp. 3HN19-14]|uniref:hypothetical protein n=1 Tax=Flavobacterium sp. 3HN19-14 TaxID=3448133 RepID=UPI003EE20322